jgi:hypothetical protein
MALHQVPLQRKIKRKLHSFALSPFLSCWQTSQRGHKQKLGFCPMDTVLLGNPSRGLCNENHSAKENRKHTYSHRGHGFYSSICLVVTVLKGIQDQGREGEFYSTPTQRIGVWFSRTVSIYLAKLGFNSTKEKCWPHERQNTSRVAAFV